MTFAEYINWIIDNPKDFKFDLVHTELGKVYYIYYVSPITRLKFCNLRFKIEGDNVIERNTELRIAKVNEVNIEKLNKLIK